MRTWLPQCRLAVTLLAIAAGASSAWPAAVLANSSRTAAPGGLADQGELDAGADQVSRQDRDRAYSRQLQDALQNEQYDEAETLAKSRIEFLLSDNLSHPAAAATALSDLALVQHMTHQYAAAVQNYSAAISLIENSEDNLSDKLVLPLRGLAQAQQLGGDFPLALESYERALHVSHVNDGPHTLGQVEILDAMSDAYIQAENYPAAFGLMERIRLLYERRYSPKSDELIPVLSKQAALLRRLNRFGDERDLYQQIVDILLENHDDDSLLLIEPYVALGRTYLHKVDGIVFRSEPTTETGETFLRRALVIAQNNPQADWQTEVDCLLALGDYFMVLGVNDQAKMQYRGAWDLMSTDAAYLDQRRVLLESPVSLRRPQLGKFSDFTYGWDPDNVDADELIEGYMIAKFDVTERGRTSGIEVMEASPEGFSKMETRIRRGVRNFVFRPQYADGEPVRSTDHSYRHEFYYLPEDVN